MVYSLLEDNNTYYISLHAESALHTYSKELFDDKMSSSMDGKIGIYTRKINADILEQICIYDYKNKDICIDFNLIDDISYNSILTFIERIQSNCSKRIQVYFLNVNKNLYERMGVADFKIINEK